jgi:hypothetical protein
VTLKASAEKTPAAANPIEEREPLKEAVERAAWESPWCGLRAFVNAKMGATCALTYS